MKRSEMAKRNLGDLGDCSHETRFFRHHKFFEYYMGVVIPYLAQKGEKKRILSMGCSSGEEVYSLYLLNKRFGLDCFLEGMDRDPNILMHAGRGHFVISKNEWSTPIMSIDEFLTLVEIIDGTPSSEEIRLRIRGENIKFSQFDLQKDDLPEDSYDVITCFNVIQPTQGFIYERERVSAVNKLFSGLKEGGYLFLFPPVASKVLEGITQEIGCYELVRKVKFEKFLKLYMEELSAVLGTKQSRRLNQSLKPEVWGCQAGYNLADYELHRSKKTGCPTNLTSLRRMRWQLDRTQQERQKWDPEKAKATGEGYQKEREIFKEHFPPEQYPFIYKKD
jgi:SAM-dependent methyltransferase